MVAEENEHNHTDREEQSPTEEKDSNILCCDSTEMLIQSVTDDIFDVIKNG